MSSLDWKAVPGFEGLYATTDGRIWSKTRGFLRRHINSDGYYKVKLANKHKRVARLVALAFHGEPVPVTLDARHKDGNKLNDHPNNLEWGTRSENCRDAVQAGVWKAGYVSEEDVIAIRKDLRSHRTIAADYGISRIQVGRLKRGLRRTAVKEAA